MITKLRLILILFCTGTIPFQLNGGFLKYEERDKYLNLEYASHMEFKAVVAPLSYFKAVQAGFKKKHLPKELIFTNRQLLEHHKKGDLPYIFIQILNLGDEYVSHSRYIVFESLEQAEVFDSYKVGVGWYLRDESRINWTYQKRPARERLINAPYSGLGDFGIPHFNAPPRVFHLVNAFYNGHLPDFLMIPLTRKIDAKDSNLDAPAFIGFRWLDLYVN